MVGKVAPALELKLRKQYLVSQMKALKVDKPELQNSCLADMIESADHLESMVEERLNLVQKYLKYQDDIADCDDVVELKLDEKVET